MSGRYFARMDIELQAPARVDVARDRRSSSRSGTIGFHELLDESWHASFYRTVITATLTGPRLAAARPGRRAADDRDGADGRGYLWLPGDAGRGGDRPRGDRAHPEGEATAPHDRPAREPLHHLRLRPGRSPRGRGDRRVGRAVRRARRERGGDRRGPRARRAPHRGQRHRGRQPHAGADRPRARPDRVRGLRRGERLHHALGALAPARPDDRRARVRRRGRAQAPPRRRRPRRPAVRDRGDRDGQARAEAAGRGVPRDRRPRTAAPTCASRRSRSGASTRRPAARSASCACARRPAR